MKMRCLAIALALALAPSSALAYATFEIEVADGAGEGFNDETPKAPVGGNMGTTLGEQRLNALRYATERWGEAIDSEVPIKIVATFDPIECSETGTTTLAYGGAESLDFALNEEGEMRLYPVALANRLMGEDLYPDEPDIGIQFNTNVDEGCIPDTTWYYGFDKGGGFASDMIDTALHEIGHGLGFQPLYDQETGELLGGVPSAFMDNLLDLTSGLHFDEMDAAQRLAAQTNRRNVVWSGPITAAAAEELLEMGMPSIASEQVPELTGEVADASYGDWPMSMSVSGELLVPPGGVCPEIEHGLSGKIVLLYYECSHSSYSAFVASQGAIGVVIERVTGFGQPPLPLDDEDMPDAVSIPVVAIGEADIVRLETAAGMGAVTLELQLEAAAPLGADEDFHVMLHATEQVYASSMSHFEQVARPNLLMEPISTPRDLHWLDVTPALMQDLGWAKFCGDEVLQQEEECDEGEENDDEEPNACRTDCMEAHCGDGVLDMGEACDDGEGNSDDKPGACRSTCEEAHCGDGVIDTGEACDDGAMNSDTAANACRSTCVEPRCGDGAMDTGETCDDGVMNSDTLANACRVSCRVASCGDGVLDANEVCERAMTPTCADDCSAINPVQAGMGGASGAAGGAAGGAGEGGGEKEDEGCGCHVVGAEQSPRDAWPALALAAVLALVTRRSHARARARARSSAA